MASVAETQAAWQALLNQYNISGGTLGGLPQTPSGYGAPNGYNPDGTPYWWQSGLPQTTTVNPGAAPPPPIPGAGVGGFGTGDLSMVPYGALDALYPYLTFPYNYALEEKQINAQIQAAQAQAAASMAAATSGPQSAAISAQGGIAQAQISAAAQLQALQAQIQTNMALAAGGDKNAAARLQAQLAAAADIQNQQTQMQLGQGFASHGYRDAIASRNFFYGMGAQAPAGSALKAGYTPLTAPKVEFAEYGPAPTVNMNIPSPSIAMPGASPAAAASASTGGMFGFNSGAPVPGALPAGVAPGPVPGQPNWGAGYQGGYAKGGQGVRFRPGDTGLVGEKGPEIFQLNPDGTFDVIPLKGQYAGGTQPFGGHNGSLGLFPPEPTPHGFAQGAGTQNDPWQTSNTGFGSGWYAPNAGSPGYASYWDGTKWVGTGPPSTPTTFAPSTPKSATAGVIGTPKGPDPRVGTVTPGAGGGGGASVTPPPPAEPDPLPEETTVNLPNGTSITTRSGSGAVPTPTGTGGGDSFRAPAVPGVGDVGAPGGNVTPQTPGGTPMGFYAENPNAAGQATMGLPAFQALLGNPLGQFNANQTFDLPEQGLFGIPGIAQSASLFRPGVLDPQAKQDLFDIFGAGYNVPPEAIQYLLNLYTPGAYAAPGGRIGF